jgi:alpha-galactosidase
MCHEMPMGVRRLARRIGMRGHDIEAKASGINHFTFFTEFRDRRTGEDLLPRIRDFYAKSIFDYPPKAVRAAKVIDRSLAGATFLEFNYSPLVVHMVREYGLVPCSVDSHIGEYVPFALDVADWMPRPLDFHEPIMVFLERAASWAATTKAPLPLHLAGHSHEEVIDIIAAMWTDTPTWIMATNVPNEGYLPDVPDGAIVEVGAMVDGAGIHPDTMPPLGEPLAGWVTTQTKLMDLVVESALTANPDLALKAVIEDPCSPPDEAACRAMFDELRTLQAAKLPF